jgi:hypothetical protein
MEYSTLRAEQLFDLEALLFHTEISKECDLELISRRSISHIFWRETVQEKL